MKNQQYISTLMFFFLISFVVSIRIESKIKTNWSKSWRIYAPDFKIAVFSSVQDCDKNCKFDSIDCLKITKFKDQEKILTELTSKTTYSNEAICYHKVSGQIPYLNKVKGAGLETTFNHDDICNSFCQTFYESLCRRYYMGGYICKK